MEKKNIRLHLSLLGDDVIENLRQIAAENPNCDLR